MVGPGRLGASAVRTREPHACSIVAVGADELEPLRAARRADTRLDARRARAPHEEPSYDDSNDRTEAEQHADAWERASRSVRGPPRGRRHDAVPAVEYAKIGRQDDTRSSQRVLPPRRREDGVHGLPELAEPAVAHRRGSLGVVERILRGSRRLLRTGYGRANGGEPLRA